MAAPNGRPEIRDFMHSIYKIHTYLKDIEGRLEVSFGAKASPYLENQEPLKMSYPENT